MYLGNGKIFGLNFYSILFLSILKLFNHYKVRALL